MPSPFARLGLADPDPDRSTWPKTWEAVGHGDRETIARWQRIVDRRLELERRHPELAPPPQTPVTSHEHVHHGGPASAPATRTGMEAAVLGSDARRARASEGAR